MTQLRLPPFRVVHAAYVASDFEAGKRRLAAMYGIDSFSIISGFALEVPGGTVTIEAAIAEASGLTVEVIHPIGGLDHLYRQAFPADPEDIAFHHFATRIMDETEWAMVETAAERNDIAVVAKGEVPRAGSYMYLDTRPQLGHMLEFIWEYGEDA